MEDPSHNSKTQRQSVFSAFYNSPKTMLMVSIETGIYRANVCRYVSEFRDFNQIDSVKKDICPISRHAAEFLTTNPEYLSDSSKTI